MSLYVKVNKDGSHSDGENETYINGLYITGTKNQKLRGNSSSKSLIQKFMFHTFHGGATSKWSPHKTVYAKFDNFIVVSGKHIRQ